MSRDTEQSKQKVKEAVSVIFRELNCMGYEGDVGEAVVEHIEREHRTLQQAFFRNVLAPVIKSFADRYNEGYYDLRNEASCELANKLKPIIEKSPLPFI